MKLALLHGEDEAVVQACATSLREAASRSVPGLFGVEDLTGASKDAVLAALRTPSFGASRAVVRVQDIGDRFTGLAEAVLQAPLAGLLVVEAAVLASRSKLRLLVEQHEAGLAVGCKAPDVAELAAVITASLARSGVTADGEAVEWLARRGSGGRLGAQNAAGMVALHAGVGGHVDLAAMRAVCEEGIEDRLDAGVFALLAGDLEVGDAVVAGALAMGATSVGVVRAAMLHVLRLRSAAAVIAGGGGRASAEGSARPPVFARDMLLFRDALARWDQASLDRAIERLWAAERACKTTAAPSDAIVRESLAWLGRRAASRDTRSASR